MATAVRPSNHSNAEKNVLVSSAQWSEHEDLSPKQVRQEFRRNTRRITSTSGLCAGYLQMNIACLPYSYADEFEAFCRKNAAPLPFFWRSEPGQVNAPELTEDLDIRSDLGLYSVFEKDKFIGNKPDLLDWPPWEDMVTFYFGCSFSFEGVAKEAGFPFRNVIEDIPTPAFETNVPLASVGPFKGTVLMTMRPCKKSTIEDIVQAIAPHEAAHGAPMHIGDPAMIGVTDISKPHCGSPIVISEDEVAVFWGCGGSANQALANAAPNHWVTHYTGTFFYLLMTDVKAKDYLTNHKPSFGDLQPKVVTVFEKPVFMSLLSDKVMEEITKIAKSCNESNGPSIGLHKQSSLVRTALVLSHSHCVAIETTRISENGMRHHDNAFTLAKILLQVEKKVILFAKDDGNVSAIREEARKAFPNQFPRDLEVLRMNQVNIQDKDKLGDLMEMNEASRSKFIIVLSQNVDSLDAMQRLAGSTAVKGTALDVSPWGYDVTAKALSCLRGCPIHSRYIRRVFHESEQFQA